MYPYQRTPMGNPYISPISRGYLWVVNPVVTGVAFYLNQAIGTA